jgi:hypothetical protein
MPLYLSLLVPAEGEQLICCNRYAVTGFEHQKELDLLSSMRVNEHYCQLDLEEEDGKFGIVCREHPQPPA